MTADTYLPCNGSWLPAAAFPDLFQVIGHQYGSSRAGDLFALPDLRPADKRIVTTRGGPYAVGTILHPTLADRALLVATADEFGTGTSSLAVRAVIALRADLARAEHRGCYTHPACGFHWHGTDGLDVPLGGHPPEPVCPRCDLARVTAERDGLLQRLDTLCREREAEAAGGGWTDADTIWPSEVRAALTGEPG